MKILFSIILFINFLFATSENVSMMNQVKNVIQKEEYIALAINKYILQTATIPKEEDDTLDWTKLLTDEYLGSDFNITNPHTSNEMKIIFDENNSAYIKGIIEEEAEYNSDDRYLYNFYINKLFRVNTIPAFDTSKEKLAKGSQILYSDIQKEIVSLINENNASKKIKLATQTCETDNYFYELNNGELIYKYCKSETSSITIYQDAPIYLEDGDDLEYIKANIGDKAYVKKNGSWYEYYYQGDGDSSIKWIASGIGDTITSVDETLDLTDRILSYIPDSKDLVLRNDGGCMLANGDIFCWGNNIYKKAGIESYGQLDHTIAPDYINTPVMLKTQISDSTQKAYNWYNNPYRIKFEKMAINSTNVCGISPIFDYYSEGQKKFGGDLYCNGLINSTYFEDLNTSTGTSILKRNKFFYTDKADEVEDSNEIYLKDIVMVDDVVAVLSDAGKIYTFGTNYSGALGIGESNVSLVQNDPKEVKNTDQVFFTKIFALRDVRGFGAIDNNGYFYIWGERPNGTYYTEPTILSESTKFDSDAIFINSKDFILKGINKVFYRTKGDKSLSELTQIPSTAVSASIYDDNGSELYLYIDKNLVLNGSDDLLKCRYTNGGTCTTTEQDIFTSAIAELNTASNLINGTYYANFSNVSIYENTGTSTEAGIKVYVNEDFENLTSDDFDDTDNYEDWKIEDTLKQNEVQTADKAFFSSYPIIEESGYSKFFGKFGRYYYKNGNLKNKSEFYSLDGKEEVTIKLDLENYYGLTDSEENQDVIIEFDMYGFDTYNLINKDSLIIFIEGESESDKKFSGTDIIRTDLGSDKYHYKLTAPLDGLKIEIGFGMNMGEDKNNGINQYSYDKLSFGIDNLKISKESGTVTTTTKKKSICTMTGLGSSSQMYCWGLVGRSLPILSTSLYDVEEITNINNLFVTPIADAKKQMAFEEFDDNGDLFLKYPTYLGGFDYEFYFK
jgi:alpha-tubulin suppressor-like RCC1 family protein